MVEYVKWGTRDPKLGECYEYDKRILCEEMSHKNDVNPFFTEEENKRYQVFLNAPKNMNDIFGSEESQVTIEGKYQHIINYDKLVDRIMNMHFLL